MNKARFLGHGSILGIPVPVLIMLLSVIVIAVLMKSTKFGTYIYAIGGNEQATIASGINTNRTKRLIFTLSGALTGLAGVVLMARLMAGMPSVGEDMNLMRSLQLLLVEPVSLVESERLQER